MYKINTDSIGDVKKYVWHYRKGNKEYGPFTYEDIIEKVREGEICPEDYVLKFGNKKFIKASEVQGLFDVEGKPEEEQENKEEVLKEQLAVGGEDTAGEDVTVIEDRRRQVLEKRRREAATSRLTLILAVSMGLGLAVFILSRLM